MWNCISVIDNCLSIPTYPFFSLSIDTSHLAAKYVPWDIYVLRHAPIQRGKRERRYWKWSRTNNAIQSLSSCPADCPRSFARLCPVVPTFSSVGKSSSVSGSKANADFACQLLGHTVWLPHLSISEYSRSIFMAMEVCFDKHFILYVVL